jgi:hypothetical protein
MLGAALASMLWNVGPQISPMDRALQQADSDLKLPQNIALAVIRTALADIDDEQTQLREPNLSEVGVDEIIKEFRQTFTDDIGAGADKLKTQMELIDVALFGKSQKEWMETYQGLSLYALGCTVHLRLIAQLLWYDTGWDGIKVRDSEWYHEMRYWTNSYNSTIATAIDSVEPGVLADAKPHLKSAAKEAIENAPEPIQALNELLSTPSEWPRAFYLAEPLLGYDGVAVTRGIIDAKAARETWLSTQEAWDTAAAA